MRMRSSSQYFKAFVATEYLNLTGAILYIDQYCTTLSESINLSIRINQLFLVIYADFRGAAIAKTNEAWRNSKGPRLFYIEHRLKLCTAKYYLIDPKLTCDSGFKDWAQMRMLTA